CSAVLKLIHMATLISTPSSIITS
ncbi:unnamed protein product, partial [Rotaria socialis]